MIPGTLESRARLSRRSPQKICGAGGWHPRRRVVQEAEELELQDVESAVDDVIPSRDQRMLEFMELLAVFEASTREMLPQNYKEMDNQEVIERLDALRIQLRSEYRT